MVIQRPDYPGRHGVALAFIQRVVQLPQHIAQCLALVLTFHQVAHCIGGGLIRCIGGRGTAQRNQLFDQHDIGAHGLHQGKGAVEAQQTGGGVEIRCGVAYGRIGGDQGL